MQHEERVVFAQMFRGIIFLQMNVHQVLLYSPFPKNRVLTFFNNQNVPGTVRSNTEST